MGHDLSGGRSRVVAVVQARMSSTRLPGKVLAAVGDHTALELLLRRLRRATELDEIVIATSTDASDDPIEREAQRLGAGVVRGPLSDVLARYIQAFGALGADAVARITADCPLSDGEVVDQVVRHWRATGADYVTNTWAPRSYPDGLDVEIISAGALRRAGDEAETEHDREHVTTYIRRNPERFSVAELRLEPALGDVRVTLDTPEDLQLLRSLVGRIGPDASMRQTLDALGVESTTSVVSHP